MDGGPQAGDCWSGRVPGGPRVLQPGRPDTGVGRTLGNARARPRPRSIPPSGVQQGARGTHGSGWPGTPRPQQRRCEWPQPRRRARGAPPRALGDKGHPKPGNARRDNGSASPQQCMGRAKSLQRAPGSPRRGPAARHSKRDPIWGRRQIGTRPQTNKHPGRATRGCSGRGTAGQGSVDARWWTRWAECTAEPRNLSGEQGTPPRLGKGAAASPGDGGVGGGSLPVLR